MNDMSNLDETYREYSMGATDDSISFRRSDVKGQGRSRPSRWRRHPVDAGATRSWECAHDVISGLEFNFVSELTDTSKKSYLSLIITDSDQTVKQNRRLLRQSYAECHYVK